jgi:diadenosine tetraphosphate (Ap4A) HIT family hydrolase
LCDSAGGEVLWQDELCRVVLVGDRDYPGFCRVILNRHASEMTDLDTKARQRLMDVVFAAERALRQLLQPAKINLASLGNMTPHLHWHVIPRFADDKHFPGSVWSEARRPGVARPIDRGALRRILRNELQAVAQ